MPSTMRSTRKDTRKSYADDWIKTTSLLTTLEKAMPTMDEKNGRTSGPITAARKERMLLSRAKLQSGNATKICEKNEKTNHKILTYFNNGPTAVVAKAKGETQDPS